MFKHIKSDTDIKNDRIRKIANDLVNFIETYSPYEFKDELSNYDGDVTLMIKDIANDLHDKKQQQLYVDTLNVFIGDADVALEDAVDGEEIQYNENLIDIANDIKDRIYMI